jgi:hypothetical protein
VIRLATSLLALPLSAQLLPASFSPQSPESLRSSTGRTLKHMQLLSVIACTGPQPATQSGGDLYRQAFAAGYVTLVPVAVRGAMEHAAADNWRVWLSWSLPLAGGAGTAATTGRLINVASRNQETVSTAAVIGTGILAAMAPQIHGRAPDPTAILASLVDPTASYPLSGGACMQGVIGAQR